MPNIGDIALRYYRDGYDKTLRFGQFFMNVYLPDTAWQELYYETDNATAIKMIAEYLTREDPNAMN
jgi:hypothetical protein